jgi:hypothetical protein
VIRSCQTCRKEFNAPSGNVKKGGGKFCSQKCYTRTGNKNPHWRGGKGTIRKDGYRIVKATGHPRANREYVLEHWLIAEKALGKPLPSKAVVHHVNNIGHENGNDNLVICENQGYHALLHMRQNLKEGKIFRDAKGRLVRPS